VLTFLTMTTKPSFRAEFKAGDGTNAAFSMTRWINTRCEMEPWSEITTATVAARWAKVAVWILADSAVICVAPCSS
jgi:hypothetical protein